MPPAEAGDDPGGLGEASRRVGIFLTFDAAFQSGGQRLDGIDFGGENTSGAGRPCAPSRSWTSRMVTQAALVAAADSLSRRRDRPECGGALPCWPDLSGLAARSWVRRPVPPNLFYPHILDGLMRTRRPFR